MRRQALLALIFIPSLASLRAQEPRLSFDVASVRPNRTGNPPAGDEPSSNVPLGPGDVYAPTGGLLTITNQQLTVIINFAYRLTANQGQTIADMAPAWARDEHFDIKARTDKANVTKDELRYMVRTLLADRFGLAVHYEDRVMPVYAMKLVKPGAPGPRLRPHPADGCSRSFAAPKDDAPARPDTIEGGFPAVCGGLLMMPSSTPTHWVIGARDIPISTISNALPSWGDLRRPVVDQTGLSGTYDFALEWTPERPAPKADSPAPQDAPTPDFLESVKKQLGLKLEGQKLSVRTLVLDHIAPLSDD